MEILLFGITREIIGQSSLNTEVLGTDKPTTVKDLLALIKERFPALKNLSSLSVAVNNDYASPETPLTENDEIALIPPVSGG
ncbi:molybdopterin converting factor subunit 1 [Robertkochia aurantiaca]|uniref:molybdopterin converting factor subunit 1 n=1 Tax=Robertkochia aurantiaca TaxID=2873700 RepID=UPI001CCF7431|nr:molybdopterin converting factor subunit 1 [Robertkochia sp. 3YJGBD-33]